MILANVWLAISLHTSVCQFFSTLRKFHRIFIYFQSLALSFLLQSFILLVYFAIARWGPRLALTLVPVHCIFRITNLWRICNDFDTFFRLLYLPWIRYDRIKRWQRCLKLCICKKKKTTATPDYRSLHIAFRQFQIGSLILDALVFDVYSKSKSLQSITKP